MTTRRLPADASPHWFTRLLAAMLAAGFLGTGAVDAYGLHRCPHHDGLPPAAAAPDAHGGHGSAGSAAGEDADAHGDHGPCTCVGTCGLAGAALPVPRPFVVALGHRSGPDQPAIGPVEPASLHFAYLHPFANAPPSVH